MLQIMPRVFKIAVCLLLLGSPNAFSESDPSLSDGIAKVYSVKGYAVITRQGSPIEKNLKAGDEIRAGDKVDAGKGAAVSIQFDHDLKNAVRIPAESRAVFESIEPTVIRLENGSLFSVVDGLAEGSTWKVSSPAAVAAVRGTVFIVRYGISNGDYFAATVDVPDDGKNSAIEISSLTDGGHVRITEGKALGLKKGEILGEQLIQNLNPESIKDASDFYSEILAERPEAENAAASVAEPLAEFTERTCDASGQNCSTQTCKMTEAGKVCEYS